MKPALNFPSQSFSLQSSQQKLCCLYLMSYPEDELASAESIHCEHTLMNVLRGLQMKLMFQHCHFSVSFIPLSPASSSSMVFLLFSVIFPYHHLSLPVCVFLLHLTLVSAACILGQSARCVQSLCGQL